MSGQELARLSVHFDGDAESFIKACNAAAKATDKFANGAADGAEKANKSFSKWLKGTATEINSFMSILGRVGHALREIYDMAEDAARNDAAAAYFKNAGKNLAELREATHGMLSDAELMKKSNLADSMGISEDTFKKLANVAHAANQKTGQSFEYMFDSIILGTARESRLLLDNLGIIVSVKDAEYKYAEAMKARDTTGQYANMTVSKMAANLDDVAKKAAFLEAVTKATTPTLQEMADVGKTDADEFDKASAAAKNFSDSIGKTLKNALVEVLPTMDKFLEKMKDIVDRFNDSNFAEKIQQLGYAAAAMGATALAAPFVGVTGMVYAGVKGSQASPLTEKEQDTARANTGLEDSLLELSDATNGAVTDFETFKKVILKTVNGAASTEQGWSLVAKEFGDDAMEAGLHVLGFAKQLDLAMESFHAIDPKKGGVKPPGGGKGKNLLGQETLVNTAEDPTWDLIESWSKPAIKHFKQANDIVQDSVQFNNKALTETVKALYKTAGEQITDDFKLKVLEITRDINKMNALKENVATGINLGGAAAQGDASGFIQMLSTIIGTAAGAPQIGTAIGGVLGPLLAQLEPVGALFTDIAEGATSLIKIGLGPLLDTLEPLGPALKFLLAAVGDLVASAIHPFLNIIDLVIVGISWFIDGLAWAVVFISPFVELAVSIIKEVFLFGFDVIFGLIEMLSGFDLQSQEKTWTAVFKFYTDTMIDNAVAMNNGIVAFIRGLGDWLNATVSSDFGLSDFGQILDEKDFKELNKSLDDNSDATKDNTKAVKNLSREIRNLPQGYRLNGALYDSQAPMRSLNSGMQRGGPHLGPYDFYRGRL